MDTYYGTKIIFARPMTRLDYNRYRGWELPTDEEGSDEGFLVEYTDKDSQINHPGHRGYISWSPRKVFEATYRPSGRMTFGHALEALRQGFRVQRAGWNGKGMFLRMIIEWETYCDPDIEEREHLPFILMKTADDKVVPWLASQTDLLAEDWSVCHG